MYLMFLYDSTIFTDMVQFYKSPLDLIPCISTFSVVYLDIHSHLGGGKMRFIF